MWLGSGHKTSPVRRGSFGNILKVPSLYWMYDVNGQKCFISVSFWCWYLEMINYSLMVWGISTIFAHIPAWHWAARAESRSIPMSRIIRGGLALTLIPWSKPILNLQSKIVSKEYGNGHQYTIKYGTAMKCINLGSECEQWYEHYSENYVCSRMLASGPVWWDILITVLGNLIPTFREFYIFIKFTVEGKADFSMVLIFVVFVQFSQ